MEQKLIGIAGILLLIFGLAGVFFGVCGLIGSPFGGGIDVYFEIYITSTGWTGMQSIHQILLTVNLGILFMGAGMSIVGVLLVKASIS